MDAETGVETVMSFVAEHPPFVVYVMVVVPAETPVTTPALLTVAAAVLEETHGLEPAAVPDPVNVVVDPTQTPLDPVIVVVGLDVSVTDAEVTIIVPGLNFL